jgi:hypothetical protein
MKGTFGSLVYFELCTVEFYTQFILQTVSYLNIKVVGRFLGKSCYFSTRIQMRDIQKVGSSKKLIWKSYFICALRIYYYNNQRNEALVSQIWIM